jgi:hypothetical protein
MTPSFESTNGSDNTTVEGEANISPEDDRGISNLFIDNGAAETAF